jgi:uncharacterized repeat protein (TIGR01451 family)
VRETVSNISVIGIGSKRARLRPSGLFRIPVTMGVMVLMMGVSASSAVFAPGAAIAAGVAWSSQSVAQPTSFSTTGSNRYAILITNTGSEASSGTITLTDTLPQGVTTAETPNSEVSEETEEPLWTCTPGAGQTVVTCTSIAVVAGLNPGPALYIPVIVEGGASGAANIVDVSGAGALGVSSSTERTLIGQSSTPFGPLAFLASALSGDGTRDTQAGSHPNALVSSFSLPSADTLTQGSGIEAEPVEDVKQIVIDLPAGVVADPQATPKCSLADLEAHGRSDPPNQDHCAPNTQVGTLAIFQPRKIENGLRIYNIIPEHGYPGEFGVYEPETQRAETLYASVRTGSDYGLRVISAPNDRFVNVTAVSATFFGNPAAVDQSKNAPLAFFSNPTDCAAAAFTTAIHVDSWQHPGRFNPDGSPDFSDPNWKGASAQSPPVTGCDALRFNPELEVKPAEPEAASADSPTGLHVDLRVRQSEDPNNLTTPELKDAVVKLPAGMAVSPSAANGLAACAPAQIGLDNAAAPSCPDAAKIGSLEIVTPALQQPLKGSVYVAQQNQNPFGGLLAIYLVAEGSGVTLKLAGHVEADPSTGQLTTRFEGNPPFEGLPQQQFSDMKLDFFGGPRAVLITPPACGTYPVSSSLTPWSGGTPAEPPSSFTVASGCSGGGFSPSFSAGTSNNQAGGYSPFSVTFSRKDGEQRLAGVQVKTPPGLLGVLKGVQQCPEPQASLGACGQESLIGHTTVGAGPGPDPFYVGGNVFLTGPYKGAPFGLSIVVHAQAGPFDLGNVIVRAAISIDPHTAQITVTSDPLPTILQGIPLDLRTINVTIDRQGFLFNPTNCVQQSITGTIAGAQGVKAGVSSPFAVGGCKSLTFKPDFKVSTSGKTSKANGASLHVHLSTNEGASTNPQVSNEADIAKVDVQLPVALPSRLTTLQKACTAAQFESNPAGCPEASFVGSVVAHTPILTNPLSGPAILVSHGGAAFPDLVLVLQGEGVRIDLVGHTEITKGHTYSRFETVPDAPVTSFDLTLPEGPHSVLTAYVPAHPYDLCTTSLTMPTEITGQNGAVIKQSTNIAVTGCPAAITVVSHGVKGRTATIQVRVPGAGKLVATAKGLSKASKTAKGATILTLKLTLTNAEAAFLGKHKGRKLKATVNLQFTPKKGGKLKTSTTVIVG